MSAEYLDLDRYADDGAPDFEGIREARDNAKLKAAQDAGSMAVERAFEDGDVGAIDAMISEGGPAFSENNC